MLWAGVRAVMMVKACRMRVLLNRGGRWRKKTINKKNLVEAGRANPHRLGPSKAWRSCRSCAVSVGVAQWFGGTGLWLGGTGGRGLVMLAGV